MVKYNTLIFRDPRQFTLESHHFPSPTAPNAEHNANDRLGRAGKMHPHSTENNQHVH